MSPHRPSSPARPAPTSTVAGAAAAPQPSSAPSRPPPTDFRETLSGAAGRRRVDRDGFTLVEMLVVIGVIGILLALILPALGPLKGSQDVTTAAYNVAAALETARNYAISNNTYTWVGFYEQDYSKTTAPTMPDPPSENGYKGVGHVTIGIVYSKDGTKLSDDTGTASVTLPATSLGAVGKLTQIYSVHLKALNAPSKDTANSSDPTVAGTLDGRPYQTDLDDTAIKQTLISSETGDTTLRLFVTQGYTFYKTIRFNPRGEANINSTLPCTRIIEVGLQPAHGNVKDDKTLNVVAVQQAGIGGAVNIYRR